MHYKLIFQKKNINELFSFLEKNKSRKCLNFLNQHDIYQFKSIEKFRNSLISNNNLNLIDGFFLSFFLSLLNLHKIKRIRGPTFTKSFLSDKKLSKNKKHFFLGIEKKDLLLLKEKFSHLKKIECYNPPYIKEIEFPEQEVAKIANRINKFRPDIVWVGIASPKQNILSQSLFKKTKAKYFFNVGAALDFLLEKKKEAPALISKIGMEWLFRLITDFKYSKKKVLRSFVGLFYLITGKVKISLERFK